MGGVNVTPLLDEAFEGMVRGEGLILKGSHGSGASVMARIEPGLDRRAIVSDTSAEANWVKHEFKGDGALEEGRDWGRLKREGHIEEEQRLEEQLWLWRNARFFSEIYTEREALAMAECKLFAEIRKLWLWRSQWWR